MQYSNFLSYQLLSKYSCIVKRSSTVYGVWLTVVESCTCCLNSTKILENFHLLIIFGEHLGQIFFGGLSAYVGQYKTIHILKFNMLSLINLDYFGTLV